MIEMYLFNLLFFAFSSCFLSSICCFVTVDIPVFFNCINEAICLVGCTMSWKSGPFEFCVKIDFFVDYARIRSEIYENHRGVIFPTPLGVFLAPGGQKGVKKAEILYLANRWS